MKDQAKERAAEIYKELRVYYWDEEYGTMTDDGATKKKCSFMAESMLASCDPRYIEFFQEVKRQIPLI